MWLTTKNWLITKASKGRKTASTSFVHRANITHTSPLGTIVGGTCCWWCRVTTSTRVFHQDPAEAAAVLSLVPGGCLDGYPGFVSDRLVHVRAFVTWYAVQTFLSLTDDVPDLAIHGCEKCTDVRLTIFRLRCRPKSRTFPQMPPTHHPCPEWIGNLPVQELPLSFV